MPSSSVSSSTVMVRFHGTATPVALVHTVHVIASAGVLGVPVMRPRTSLNTSPSGRSGSIAHVSTLP